MSFRVKKKDHHFNHVVDGTPNEGFQRDHLDEDITQKNLEETNGDMKVAELDEKTMSSTETIAVNSESTGDLPLTTRDSVEKPPSRLSEMGDKMKQFLEENKNTIRILFKLVIHALIIIYFAFATKHYVTVTNSPQCLENCEFGWCNGYGLLVLIMFFMYVGMVLSLISTHFGPQISKGVISPLKTVTKRLLKKRGAKLIVALVVLAAFGVFLYFETTEERDRLRSLLGIVSVLTIGFLISKSPGRVNWRPVFLGVTCQILLGLFTIRWDVGRSIFDCLGKKVETFLGYAKAGAAFVYGDNLIYTLGVFAFAVLAVIFFFSLMISILYYLGIMQWVIFKMGWVLQSILGTTVCESVNAAANIFLGQSESPLLIRPYIQSLTNSELHSIMASGFATVSGSVLAAYIGFGANPANLITASVMAAPASLCLSKLIWPETQESQTTSKNIVMQKSESTSLLDAATNGCLQATELVLCIIANLIGFVAFIAFVNGVLGYFGGLIGVESLSMQLILGKVFIPIAWVIGVPIEECEIVAQIIGIKTVVNEFIAFEQLGEEIAKGLSARSASIATFAVCGFANPSSMGIMIGALSAMAPNRRQSITEVAFRAFIAGTMVCFMTASIAGLLIDPDSLKTGAFSALNSFNAINRTAIMS